MGAATASPTTDSLVVLDGIDWDTYEKLRALDTRRFSSRSVFRIFRLTMRRASWGIAWKRTKPP